MTAVGLITFISVISNSRLLGLLIKWVIIIYILFSPKQNEFVYIVGHAGDSFAVIL